MASWGVSEGETAARKAAQSAAALGVRDGVRLSLPSTLKVSGCGAGPVVPAGVNGPHVPPHPEKHLFTPTGQPTLSLSDRRLIRECERLIPQVDQARGELLEALAADNSDACVTAARRFLALGLLLGGFARDDELVSHEQHGYSVKAPSA